MFATKPENTPPSLYAAIDTAEDLRRLNKRNLLPPITDLTAWEVACYVIAEEAADSVEAEIYREMDKDNSQRSVQKVGNVEGEVGLVEPGGVFEAWGQQ